MLFFTPNKKTQQKVGYNQVCVFCAIYLSIYLSVHLSVSLSIYLCILSQGGPTGSPRPGLKTNSALHEIDFPPPPSDLPSEDSTPQPPSPIPPSPPLSHSPLPSSPSLQARYVGRIYSQGNHFLKIIKEKKQKWYYFFRCDFNSEVVGP